MTERVSQPFTSYNASDCEARVLTGNWYEERCLKSTTGITRNKAATLTKSTASAAAAEAAASTIYAVRQDHEAGLATFPRVIEHTAQTVLNAGKHQLHTASSKAPAGWCSQAGASYQDPQMSNQQQPMRYVNTPKAGPREQRELQQLMAAAAERTPSADAPPSFNTTHKDLFQAHNLEGLQVGARVMKTQDGGPVQRDINFLAETRIVPRSLVDRLTPDAGSLSGATATARLADQSEPITLYSEAAARQELGRFNGTGTLAGTKARPMNRTDFFTKLPGDVNQVPDDQL